MASNVQWDIARAESMGSAMMPDGPAITSFITIVGGKIMDGAGRWRSLGVQYSEAALTPETTTDVDAVVQTCRNIGARVIYGQVAWGRKYNESGTNWGVAQYSIADSPRDNTLNSGKMDLLCYLIYRCKQHGIRVCITNNSYRPWLIRAGLPQGTYTGYSMFQLCPSARTVWKNGFAQALNYGNPYNGIALKDDPTVIWKVANEDSLRKALFNGGTNSFGGGRPGDTSYTTRWMDQITNAGVTAYPASGNSYWNAEANSEWAAAASAVGWTGTPYASFPDFPGNAIAITLTGADLAKCRDTVVYIEKAWQTDVYNWIRGFNSNIVPIMQDSRYCDSRLFIDHGLGSPGPIWSGHIYLVNGEGIAGADQAGYVQRGSAVQATWNGGATAYWAGQWAGYTLGSAPTTMPRVITEAGEYGESRWGAPDMVYHHSLLYAMHDIDGVWWFKGAAQKPAYLGTGTAEIHDHMLVRRPGFQLAMRGIGPVFHNGWITPLPQHVTTVSASTMSTNGGFAPSDFQAGGNGSNSTNVWKRRNYLALGSDNLDAANWTAGAFSAATLSAATISSPITLVSNADATAQVRIYNGGTLWTVKASDGAYRAAGWVGTVPASSTLGPITTGTIGESLPNFVLFWRSDGETALGSNTSRLYFHGPDYPTNCGGISMTTDATNVSAGQSLPTFYDNGTFDNIRLYQPPAVQLSLQVTGDKNVWGVSADAGALVSISKVYNSGAGTLTFTTDPAYPEYIILPTGTSIVAYLGGGRRSLLRMLARKGK